MAILNPNNLHPNNLLFILYRFLQWRFYLVRETQPNEVVGPELFRKLYLSTELITILLLFFYLWLHESKLTFFKSRTIYTKSKESYFVMFHKIVQEIGDFWKNFRGIIDNRAITILLYLCCIFASDN